MMGGSQSQKRGLQDESTAEGQDAFVSPDVVQTPPTRQRAWQHIWIQQAPFLLHILSRVDLVSYICTLQTLVFEGIGSCQSP